MLSRFASPERLGGETARLQTNSGIPTMSQEPLVRHGGRMLCAVGSPEDASLEGFAVQQGAKIAKLPAVENDHAEPALLGFLACDGVEGDVETGLPLGADHLQVGIPRHLGDFPRTGPGAG